MAQRKIRHDWPQQAVPAMQTDRISNLRRFKLASPARPCRSASPSLTAHQIVFSPTIDRPNFLARPAVSRICFGAPQSQAGHRGFVLRASGLRVAQERVTRLAISGILELVVVQRPCAARLPMAGEFGELLSTFLPLIVSSTAASRRGAQDTPPQATRASCIMPLASP